MQDEGVIKFDLQYTESEAVAGAAIAELNTWRRVLPSCHCRLWIPFMQTTVCPSVTSTS